MNQKISQLNEEAISAKRALEKALLEEWPKDRSVQFYIMHGQKNASIGTVIGHHHGPFLRVRMDSRRQHVKDIHYSDIF